MDNSPEIWNTFILEQKRGGGGRKKKNEGEPLLIQKIKLKNYVTDLKQKGIFLNQVVLKTVENLYITTKKSIVRNFLHLET